MGASHNPGSILSALNPTKAWRNSDLAAALLEQYTPQDPAPAGGREIRDKSKIKIMTVNGNLPEMGNAHSMLTFTKRAYGHMRKLLFWLGGFLCLSGAALAQESIGWPV